MRIKKLNRAIVLFSFLRLEAVHAQKIFFRHYTVTDGLCANTIWHIQQDEQGYMWFGTKYRLIDLMAILLNLFSIKGISGSIGNNFIRKIFKYDVKYFGLIPTKVFTFSTSKPSILHVLSYVISQKLTACQSVR